MIQTYYLKQTRQNLLDQFFLFLQAQIIKKKSFESVQKKLNQPIVCSLTQRLATGTKLFSRLSFYSRLSL